MSVSMSLDGVASAVRAALAGDTAAAAALASKVLGYAVVAGSSILKLPQASTRAARVLHARARVRCCCAREERERRQQGLLGTR
jgi:hypothetical protein